MIPAPFDYVAAESTTHAIDLLESLGDDATLLAAGHSLLPMMKLRLAAPSVPIHIGRPSELVAAARVPRRPGAAWGYQKFVRRANDWAIVGAAAIDGRIALANMGPVPLRAHAAEQALADGASAAEAAELAADGTEPGEDVHADRAYRHHLARILTRRALEHRT